VPPLSADLRLDRRGFLGLAGLTAGTAALASCRRPVEKIYPFAERPEERLPGVPVRYATAAQVGGEVLGLLVESHDGRPTKIEGNPRHPENQGATSALAQAAIFDLYNPDRARTPSQQGTARSLVDFWAALEPRLVEHRASGGDGLVLVVEEQASPTLLRLLGELKLQLPQLQLFEGELPVAAATRAGCAMIGAAGLRPLHWLETAEVVAALDCDMLGMEPGAVRTTRELSIGRSVSGPLDEMNRLYVVEPTLSLTGAMADHRLRLRASQVEPLLRALAYSLFIGERLIAPAGGEAAVAALRPVTLEEQASRFVAALAKDLATRPGRALVCVGMRQPPRVHALALLVNAGLQSLGDTLQLLPDPWAALGVAPLSGLAAALESGKLQTLLSLGGNPAYTAPGALGLGALWSKVAFSAHLSEVQDETAAVSQWHLPRSHSLEAWGDLRAAGGTASVVQPLIAPLFASTSAIEVVARLLGKKPADAYSLVRATWTGALPAADPDRAWARWLHDGLVGESAFSAAQPELDFSALLPTLARPVKSAPRFEVDFYLDASVYDGRYADNPWLQELPDPLTKLVWDNAARISAHTARRHGLAEGETVRLSSGGRRVVLPLLLAPGQADETIALALGYGRSAAGQHGTGIGVDVTRLRSPAAPWFESGVALQRIGDRQQLVTTQEHHFMEGRPLSRDGTLAQFRANPRFAKEMTPKHPDLPALWEPPLERGGQQWGMCIDLNLCTGCNACMLACQAENNILVVGKENTRIGREMHWIRVDRYFRGDVDDPEVLWQPINCQQCEFAPCESVCPVAATSHSPSGLNDQVYNRCVGTRYCANNCPYKVRRFNFFNYALDLTELERMGKNPDVTVRLRGVMEKCTYCVQRINRARVDAKRDRGGVLNDGEVLTACQQACPARAISFGDLNDPAAEVSRRKQQPREYALLGEINTRPRTTYLARLRNPNPELSD